MEQQKVLFTITEILKALTVSDKLELSAVALIAMLKRDDAFPPGPQGRSLPRFCYDETLEVWLRAKCMMLGLLPQQAKEISFALRRCIELQLQTIPPGWPHNMPFQIQPYSPSKHWNGTARIEIEGHRIECFLPPKDKTPGEHVLLLDLDKARWGLFTRALCRFLITRAEGDFSRGNHDGGNFFLRAAHSLGVRPLPKESQTTNQNEDE